MRREKFDINYEFLSSLKICKKIILKIFKIPIRIIFKNIFKY